MRGLLRSQAYTTCTETGVLAGVPNDEKIYPLEEINREAGGRQTSRSMMGIYKRREFFRCEFTGRMTRFSRIRC